MKYISNLIGALNNEERNQVKAADIKGRELQLLEAYFKVWAAPKPLPEPTAESLKISATHFDKICSVLTNKVVAIVTDNSFEQKSVWLQQKGLSELLLHEIKLEHREILKQNSKAAKRIFYGIAFECLRRFSFDILELKMLRQYADYLKDNLAKNDELTPIIVEFKYLYVENVFYFLTGGTINNTDKALAAIENLLPNPEKFEGLAEYTHYHFCLAAYCKDYKSDQLKAIEHGQLALANGLKCKVGIEDNFIAAMHGTLAIALAQNSEFEASLNLYKEGFAKHENYLTKTYFHNYLFSCIALAAGDFDQSEKHGEKYLKSFLQNSSSLYYRFDVLRFYALLRLYQNRYEDAFDYLKQMQSIKRKDMTEAGDIMLRMLDNVYFLVTGDYDLAMSYGKKNMRYLKKRNYTFENCEYMYLFYSASELAKMKLQGKTDIEKIKPYIDRCQKGLLKMFGGLLVDV